MSNERRDWMQDEINELTVQLTEIKRLLDEANGKVEAAERSSNNWMRSYQQLEAAKGQGEPVHQIDADGMWFDVSEKEYLGYDTDQKRILYTPPRTINRVGLMKAAYYNGYTDREEELRQSSSKPVGWVNFHEKGVSHGFYSDTGLTGDFLLFTTPPSTALSVELAIRKCAEVVDHILAEGGGTYGDKILALLQSPPSLEAHLREFGMKVAMATYSKHPKKPEQTIHEWFESIVDNVLKGMK